MISQKSLGFTIIGALILFISPHSFLKIFTSDETLLNLGSKYIRVMVFIYPLIGITMVVGRTLQGMGLGLPGLVLGLIRTLLVAIPLAYLFIFVFDYGYLSIPIAMIIGALIANFVGALWLKYKLNKLHIYSL